MRKRKKTNWDILQQREPNETTQYRDVYEDQQLERADMGQMRTMKSRIILDCFLTVLVFIGLYFLLSVFQLLGGIFTGTINQAVDDTVGPGITSQAPEETAPVHQDGILDIGEAPMDISLEDFMAGYFTAVDGSGALARYQDARGNTYTRADIEDLHKEVQAGKWLSDRQKTVLDAERLKQENGGILPVSMAPRNISWDAFTILYAKKVNRGFVTLYQIVGSDQKYRDHELHAIWESVSDGTAGSGRDSDIAEIGGTGWSELYQRESGSEVVNGTIQRGIGYYLRPTSGKIMLDLLLSALFWVFMFFYLKKNLSAQNSLYDVKEINQYKNDQHIALPEEIQAKFDWFPDVGAHCSVQVNSMISHMALTNKGLHSVQVTRRAPKDVMGKDGEVEVYKGDVLLDADEQPIVDVLPMVDEKFMTDLFDASGLPKEKTLRKRYDPSKIDYNPGDKNRDKLKGAETLADMINKYWEMPDYEPQRPAGAYLVDTQPVNTMV